MKKNNGITLLVLVVTIVVLLILAGVSVSILGGENRIIEQAIQAKQEQEISDEKEILDVSIAQAVKEEAIGNITGENLEISLELNTGKDKTKVYDGGNTFVVQFVEKNRYYEVYRDGKIEGPISLVTDSNPGNLEKGINDETLEGTEDKTFEIWCIEDLVEFSENYTKYKNASIKLGRTLNFESKFSYTDGKMLGCTSVDGLMEALTNSDGEGFKPIKEFSGNFYGQNFSIENLYVKTTENAGLFGTTSGKVSDLTITGNITSTENSAGGVVGSGSSTIIENCNNYASVLSMQKATGGIVGTGASKIYNCYNSGEIISYGTNRASNEYITGTAGGIVGGVCGDIQNCGNSGKINSTISAGGIIGYKYVNFYIKNCYNTGEVNGTEYAGGQVGWLYYNTILSMANCCNTGIASGKTNSGGIIGRSGAGTGSYTANMPTIKNTYSTPSTLSGIGNITNSEVIVFEDDLAQVIENLNSYIKSNEDGIETTDWLTWDTTGNEKIKFKNI